MFTYILHKDKLTNDIMNCNDDEICYYKVRNEEEVKREIEELEELEKEFPDIFELIGYLVDYCDIENEAFDKYTVEDLHFALEMLDKEVVANEEGEDVVRNEKIKDAIINENKKLISALLSNSTFAKPKTADLF